MDVDAIAPGREQFESGAGFVVNRCKIQAAMNPADAGYSSSLRTAKAITSHNREQRFGTRAYRSDMS
jgi:hypothetical protein